MEGTRRTDPAGRRGQPPSPPARCDLCGAPMVAVHCKLVCETCGFTRDCSDP